MRIALAGFQHETNTFAASRADLEDFEIADSWPALLEGSDVLTQTRGMNLPIAGAAAAAPAQAELVPILWCAAEPSGPVTDRAFDTISDRILQGVEQGNVDSIYLDLHGAMVTESHFDGEAALLSRLRHQLGPDIPIVISLDLHANISAELVALADVITIYRTYPHLDMADCGARAMQHLVKKVAGAPYVAAFHQVDYLVPLHAQGTDVAPARALYAQAASDDTSSAFTEIALGFTAADVPDCGPSVVAYAPTKAEAKARVAAMAEGFRDAQGAFATALSAPELAVRAAMNAKAPTLLADVQDNPGAGGSADTTGLLKALVDARARDAVLGMLCDPVLAERAAAAGVGASLTAPIGGHSDGQPYHGTFTVLAETQDTIAYTGRMYGGGVATPGPSCLLQCTDNGADIQIAVTSQRIQCLDQALFRHFGVALERCKLICVKSTVHYRDAFGSLTDRIINVAAPGAFPCKLEAKQYRNLRPNLCVA